MSKCAKSSIHIHIWEGRDPRTARDSSTSRFWCMDPCGKIWPVSNCSGSKCRKRRILFTIGYLVFLGWNVWRKISQGKLPFYRGYAIKFTETSLRWESRGRYRAFFIQWWRKKIYQNKGHGGVGLRETFGPETAEIENIVWQTINGVFEEVLNPEYFKRTVEQNPWTWTLRQVFNSSFHLIGRVNSILIGQNIGKN